MNWSPFDNRTQEQKRLLWIGANAERVRYTKWAARGFVKVFKAQVKAFAAAIDDSQTLDSLPVLVGETVEKTKPLLVKQYRMLYNAVGLRFFEKTLTTIKSRKDLRTQWEREVARYLQEEGGKRIVDINDTTKKRIAAVVEKMVAEGKGLRQIAEEITTQFQLAEIIKNRSLVIAHTETISASNWGSLQGAKTSGAKVKKEWISTRDSATRTIVAGAAFDHLLMDSKTAGLDDDFEVPKKDGSFELMAFPGDPRGSAGNVINCRCVIGYQRSN